MSAQSVKMRLAKGQERGVSLRAGHNTAHGAFPLQFLWDSFPLHLLSVILTSCVTKAKDFALQY